MCKYVCFRSHAPGFSSLGEYFRYSSSLKRVYEYLTRFVPSFPWSIMCLHVRDAFNCHGIQQQPGGVELDESTRVFLLLFRLSSSSADRLK